MWSELSKRESQRPSEVEKYPSLWGTDGVRPPPVTGGMIDDKWFLHAIAAISEYPDKLKAIFRNNEYPKNGLFELNMYMYGEPHKVVVDDLLPRCESSYPCYTSKRSPNGAWYAPIIEKAAGKYYGSLMNLKTGNIDDAIHAFFGVPTITFEN